MLLLAVSVVPVSIPVLFFERLICRLLSLQLTAIQLPFVHPTNFYHMLIRCFTILKNIPTISPNNTTFSPLMMNTPLGMSPYSLPTCILSIVRCNTKLANWSTLRKYPINVRPSRSKTINFSVKHLILKAEYNVSFYLLSSSSSK